MGCSISKMDHKERVANYKARKSFMKQAVASRHALAAAHAAYMEALRNMGAALRQFAESSYLTLPTRLLSKLSPESILLSPASTFSSSTAIPNAAIFSTPLQNDCIIPKNSKMLSPPASPLPVDEQEEDCLFGKSQPLHHHSLSADNALLPPRCSAWELSELCFCPQPPLHLQEKRKSKQMPKNMGKQQPPILDLDDNLNSYEEGEQSEPDQNEYEGREAITHTNKSICENVIEESEALYIQKALTSVPSFRGERELVNVLQEIDDLFIRAYECGKDVSRILEVLRFSYQSKIVNSKDCDNHVRTGKFHPISWRLRPAEVPKVPFAKTDMMGEIEGCGMAGSHGSTLDRLYAWEKKLYEEAKEADMIRVEYEQQCTLLRNKKFNGARNETIDKTRAAMKVLRTRIAVALHAAHTATTTIRKLQDHELYPQLLELLQGLALMWRNMYDCHQGQRRAVLDLKALMEGGACNETSKHHQESASHLEFSLIAWYSSLDRVFGAQRDYLHNLNGWLKVELNSSARQFGDNFASSGRSAPPPVYHLCLAWQRTVDRLPYQAAMGAIQSFAAAVQVVVNLQSDEVQHRKKAKNLSKKIEKSFRLHETELDWVPRHYHELLLSKVTHYHELLLGKAAHANTHSTKIVLIKKLEEENEKIGIVVQGARGMTLNSFQTGLPSVFEAVTRFANLCSDAYQELCCQINSDQLTE
ncbi:hypothetical protein O6H91_19G055500 [Diphasiastrum complanatum]|uniref:Uncharacterized protein n=1 Tax=Diphasiastrum complanatum TaxID=34168 RepID=A0ACC2AVF3_DIPCM|nr:hypothetical protein O6H91_19G055500 [Diphasiastrum complanatum]